MIRELAEWDGRGLTEHPDSWQTVGHPRLERRFSLSSWPRECLLGCATDKGVTARRSWLTMTRNFDRGSDIHNLPLNSRTRANSTFHLVSSFHHLDVKTRDPKDPNLTPHHWNLIHTYNSILITIIHKNVFTNIFFLFIILRIER